MGVIYVEGSYRNTSSGGRLTKELLDYLATDEEVKKIVEDTINLDLSNKADKEHTHSEYVVKTELNNYSEKSHNHDLVYSKLSHEHTANDISGLDGTVKNEITNIINNSNEGLGKEIADLKLKDIDLDVVINSKADINHSHSNYASTANILESIEQHNLDQDSHSDIRNLIYEGISNNLTAYVENETLVIEPLQKYLNYRILSQLEYDALKDKTDDIYFIKE